MPISKFKLNKNQLKLAASALAVIILAVAGFLAWNKPKQAEASWWNDQWLYRQAITVNKTVAAEQNVYITLTLNTLTASTSMQADCGDFRFLTTDGKARPHYIISGCRSASFYFLSDSAKSFTSNI